MKGRGYKHHQCGKFLKIGKLNFYHGNHYATINHARNHLAKLGTNVMYGHHHDLQQSSVTHMDGVKSAWSIGCLKDMTDEKNSWLGNRKRSILDINATAFLSQETRVPHLTVIFGTIPRLYFYAEYTPRMDLRTNPDYLNKYYEPVNKDFLEFRDHANWTRFVSHGTYLRSFMSPICVSSHAELNDENIDFCETYLKTFIEVGFNHTR